MPFVPRQSYRLGILHPSIPPMRNFMPRELEDARASPVWLAMIVDAPDLTAAVQTFPGCPIPPLTVVRR